MISVRGSRCIPTPNFTRLQANVLPPMSCSTRFTCRGVSRATSNICARWERGALWPLQKSCSERPRCSSGVIREIRLGAASMAPYPTRLFETEAALLGKTLTRETVQAARKALLAEAKPIDDIRSTAMYRRRVAANLLDEFLLELCREGSRA